MGGKYDNDVKRNTICMIRKEGRNEGRKEGIVFVRFPSSRPNRWVESMTMR